MGITGIEGVSSNTLETKSDKSNVLGKDEFMKIFVAQLQYQDPLNPLKPDQLISQLAQLTAVERLQNMEETLQEMKESFERSNLNNLVNILGKKVGVSGNTICEGDEIQIKPQDDYDEIILTLVDKTNGSLKEVRINKGEPLIFKNEDEGEKLVYISALKDGKQVSCSMDVFRIVRGISTEDGTFKMVFLNGDTVSIESVKAIKD